MLRALALTAAAATAQAQTAGEIGRFVLDPEGAIRDAFVDEPGIGDVLRTLDRMEARLRTIAGGQLGAEEMSVLVTSAFDANAVRERLVIVRGAGLRLATCQGTAAGCGEMLGEIDGQLFVVASELAALPPSPEQAAALELVRKVHFEALADAPDLAARRAQDYAVFVAATAAGLEAEIADTRRAIADWFVLEDLRGSELRGLSAAALRQEIVRSRGPQILALALGRAVGNSGLRIHATAPLSGDAVGLWHSCGVERVYAIGQLEIDELRREDISLAEWVADPSAYAEDPAGPRAEVRFQWEWLRLLPGDRLDVAVGSTETPPQPYRDRSVEDVMSRTLPAAAVFPASECIYRGRTTVEDRGRGEIELQDTLATDIARLDTLLARLGNLNGTLARVNASRGN